MKHMISLILIIGCLTAKPNSDVIQSAQDIINVFQHQVEKRHISDDLRNIALHGHSLPEETKEQLKLIGFNFDGPIVNRSSLVRSESSGLDQTYDNGKFRYHYTTSGSNAVDDTDSCLLYTSPSPRDS